MTKKQQAFVRDVWAYYKTNGRDLPWRNTKRPYHILVSEIMLQQTQVDRVIPKYKAFLRTFPSIRSLARAPLADVLALWSGLGYNRRAKNLKNLAVIVARDYNGRIPRDVATLETLPGIGSYTASAVAAFAFNTPTVLIETNIRTVFIHHFFAHVKTPVHDADIRPLIATTLDHENPREWYFALMDYGAHLKRTHGNSAARKSRHYTRQSAFTGSDRQLRGALLRALHGSPDGLTPRALAAYARRDVDVTKAQLAKLHAEGFLEKHGRRYLIASE